MLETADDEIARPYERIREDDDEQDLQARFEGPRGNRLKLKPRPRLQADDLERREEHHGDEKGEGARAHQPQRAANEWARHHQRVLQEPADCRGRGPLGEPRAQPRDNQGGDDGGGDELPLDWPAEE